MSTHTNISTSTISSISSSHGVAVMTPTSTLQRCDLQVHFIGKRPELPLQRCHAAGSFLPIWESRGFNFKCLELQLQCNYLLLDHAKLLLQRHHLTGGSL